MRGKNKCRILRQIRQKIAEENDIPLVTQECTYQGECSGTCPKCEQELRDLEQQMERRRSLGKRVTVSVMTAGMLLSLTGCPAQERSETPMGSQIEESIPNIEDTEYLGEPTPPLEDEFTDGATDTAAALTGLLPDESEAILPTQTEEVELMGRIATICDD